MFDWLYLAVFLYEINFLLQEVTISYEWHQTLALKSIKIIYSLGIRCYKLYNISEEKSYIGVYRIFVHSSICPFQFAGEGSISTALYVFKSMAMHVSYAVVPRYIHWWKDHPNPEPPIESCVSQNRAWLSEFKTTRMNYACTETQDTFCYCHWK